MTLKTIEKSMETNNSVFYVANYGTNILGLSNIYDFTLDVWPSTNQKNKDLNTDFDLYKSDIRPFGKWYEAVFPGIEVTAVNYMTIFSVSKEHIRQRTKESYEELIKQVNRHKNEESAHYFERGLLAVFHPIPSECLYS
jgi:hypothetical protein